MAIRFALKPVTVLRRELSEEKINDLSKLSIEISTKELQPFVDTLNKLFERLSSAFDAAHDISTSLSFLKINVHNLHLTQSKKLDGDSQHFLVILAESVDRMAYVVD